MNPGGSGRVRLVYGRKTRADIPSPQARWLVSLLRVRWEQRLDQWLQPSAVRIGCVRVQVWMAALMRAVSTSESSKSWGGIESAGYSGGQRVRLEQLPNDLLDRKSTRL